MCILIPLVVGLISAFLGYLLGKLLGKSNSDNCSNCNSLKIDLDSCRKKSAQLQADLDALKLSRNTQGSSFVANANIETLLPFNGDLAFAAFGKKIKQDDLKLIEGIGPKIEELFHAAGIKTWKQLGETSIEKCQQILDSGGERFTIHNPGTWPKQSEMAYNGLWNDLKNWQEQLDGGKE